MGLAENLDMGEAKGEDAFGTGGVAADPLDKEKGLAAWVKVGCTEVCRRGGLSAVGGGI